MGYMLCFDGLQTFVLKEHLYSCTKVFLLVAFLTDNLQPSCQDRYHSTNIFYASSSALYYTLKYKTTNCLALECIRLLATSNLVCFTKLKLL